MAKLHVILLFLIPLCLGGHWDAYIDNLIAQSKDGSGNPNADKAAIISLDGGSPWTGTSEANRLKLQGSEGADIAKVFKSKDFTPFMAGGVRVEGTKYFFLRVEDGKLVLAKKKGHGAITMQASKTAIVIAHTPEGNSQGNTNKAVDVIAEYFESLGM